MLIIYVLGPFGTITLHNSKDNRKVFVQTDWDYPGIATAFGWSISSVKPKDCKHESTDGTIRCDTCGTEPGVFISAAYDWLVEHEGTFSLDPELPGECVEDPGYFVPA